MKTLLTLTAVIFVLSTSCKKKESAGSTGEITGVVTQLDQYAREKTSDLADVVVTIEGTEHQTKTDENGKYSFNKVKPGTYTLEFSKAGFALFKLQQVVFPGNGKLVKHASIHEKITYPIRDVSLITKPNATNYLELKLKTENLDAVKELTILFGKSPEMDINNPDSYEYSDIVRIYADYKFPLNADKESVHEIRSPYSEKTTFYAKVYRSSPFFIGYLEAETKKVIATNTTEPYPTVFKLSVP